MICEFCNRKARWLMTVTRNGHEIAVLLCDAHRLEYDPQRTHTTALAEVRFVPIIECPAMGS